MWYNYFVEFEKKQKSRNRLVLGLFNLESRKKAKIYVNAELKIRTRFLSEKESKILEEEIAKDEVLKNLVLEKKIFGNRVVYSLTAPCDPEVIKRIDNPRFGGPTQKRYFQTGHYDKLIRFSGFYPDRMCFLGKDLEERISGCEGESEAELSEIDFGDIISYDQFKQLPMLFIDIEKPLWKHDDEKQDLDEREELVKQEKKYAKKKSYDDAEKQKHVERVKRISVLEEKLTKEFPVVGTVKLWEDKVDARVAFVTTIWQDGDKETKELFVYDPYNEIKKQNSNGYQVLRFGTEQELVSSLIGKYHERNPIVCCGHNQVYDVTQIRYAAEKTKLVFDPAVSKIKPKRDFIEHFLQRLRQDMVYVDTLWASNIFKPYLKQRRLGTSLKLADVANSYGIDFTKSLSHEQLREVELSRLLSEDAEERANSANRLLDYSCADLDKTREIFNRLPLELFFKIKEILPFSTLSEITSFTNCMDKLNEKIYFDKFGNFLRTKYAKKRRIDDRQEFNSKFAGMKDKRLRNVGFTKQKGFREGVSEYYFSLEEALKERVFSYCPSLKNIYDWANSASGGRNSQENSKDITFGFLNYMKTFCVDMFLDYYLAKTASSEFVSAVKSKDFDKALSSKNSASYRKWQFKDSYGFDFSEFERAIAEAYESLRRNLGAKARIVDFQGDYLFLRPYNDKGFDVPNLHFVRKFRRYECSQKSKTVSEPDKQCAINFS